MLKRKRDESDEDYEPEFQPLVLNPLAIQIYKFFLAMRKKNEEDIIEAKKFRNSFEKFTEEDLSEAFQELHMYKLIRWIEFDEVHGYQLEHPNERNIWLTNFLEDSNNKKLFEEANFSKCSQQKLMKMRIEKLKEKGLDPFEKASINCNTQVFRKTIPTDNVPFAKTSALLFREVPTLDDICYRGEVLSTCIDDESDDKEGIEFPTGSKVKAYN